MNAGLLGTNEAADYLGLSPATLRWRRHANRGPKSFVVGRLVKYRQVELDRYLEACEAATARGGVL
jgi:predicted DNA-binding transcriptional regulator AlpA